MLHMEACLAVSVEDVGGWLGKAAEICEQHGVRFTELRREILSLLLAADGPVCAFRRKAAGHSD